MKQPIDSKWRMCCKAEHIKHIVLGCKMLVPFKYTNRHNKVAGYIHNGQYVNIWGYRLPTSIMNMYLKGSQIQQYHYYVGHTGYHILNTSKPTWYSTAWQKREDLLLIDIAIPDDSNINTKETEKLSKYKDLETEVSRMWKVRIKIVPIINGALDTIKKGLDQKLKLLPSHPLTIELQKITLMCTAHIICKVLG